jgi:hypothetical protein
MYENYVVINREHRISVCYSFSSVPNVGWTWLDSLFLTCILGSRRMKPITLALGVALVAVSAFAAPASHVGAPAPLIGMGIQGAVIVGSVVFGSKLFRRWKNK